MASSFLESAFAQAGLEEQILASFDDAPAKMIASTMVSYLVSPSTNDHAVLPTGAHIRWAMQAIGYCFALPIDDSHMHFISYALEIYSRWTLQASRPPAVVGSLSALCSVMFCHLSRLFQPRKRLSVRLLEKQAHLCTDALSIFLEAGRALGHVLSPSCWEVLLYINLGVADMLLRQPTGDASAMSLANLLEPLLLRNLLDLWMRAGRVSSPLWSALQEACSHWRHRPRVFSHWRCASLGLTARLFATSTPPLAQPANAAKSTVVAVRWPDGSESVFPMLLHDLALSWQRLCHVLGHPNMISELREGRGRG
jgi:hypothetical protein